MKRIIAILAAAALTFGGCSVKNRRSSEEMPPDTPWNRGIMETDSGYYYAARNYIMGLRYVEKSNGTDIYLCAKPECAHSGEESCAATYKGLKVSNYILYEGSIYFAADTPTDDTQGITLYKASLDGTSVDKVAEVTRVKYTEENEDEFGSHLGISVQMFIIHKGCAYIPYNIGMCDKYNDFAESGFAKVDIQTGDVEMLFSTNKFLEKADVNIHGGIGDYVYYSARSNISGQNGGFRYNIKTGETEKITGQLGKDLDDTKQRYRISGVTENAVYVRYSDSYNAELIGYDPVTYEPNGVSIDLGELAESWGMLSGYLDLINYYDNKIFVLTNTDVNVYSDKGEPLGSCKWCNPPEKEDGQVGIRNGSISDGKFYIDFESPLELNGYDFEKTSENEDKEWRRCVYSCPIEDVISGTGKWEMTFVYKH